jgi:death-on-curing protein
MVQSAIDRPYGGYYRSIAAKAAALFESMASNHGFSDGNKRTTIILTHLLLSRSGYELTLQEDDGPLDVAMENLVLEVVQHQRGVNDLVEWFRKRVRRRGGK